jgi:vacuolar-type H+-ATPase subunit I/STV1
MDFKKIITATFISVTAAAGFSQQIINVEQGPKDMSKGSRNAFTVVIPESKLKKVEKEWADYIKKGAKGKVEELNGETILRTAFNKNISTTPFTIYSKFLETPAGVRLTAFILQNDSVEFSSDPASDKNIASNKYVRDFAVLAYRDVVQEQVDAENDKLNKLKEELDELRKEEDKSIKKISGAKRDISKAELNTATAKSEILTKINQITTQKDVVARLSNSLGNEQKEAEKTLKGLEDDKKKLERNIEKMGKDIDKSNEDIRNEERNIDESKRKQNAKERDIDNQKGEVQKAEQKLKGIQ